MTELMLRLIKDNKIVGYMWLSGFNTDLGLTVRWALPGEIDTYTHPIKPCIFDSFDLGIKIGNEWIFDGDICQGQDNETTITFRVYYENGMFCVQYEDAGAYPLEDCLGNGNWPMSTKVIGNIHEVEK